jgi:hypothetical protein
MDETFFVEYFYLGYVVFRLILSVLYGKMAGHELCGLVPFEQADGLL